MRKIELLSSKLLQPSSCEGQVSLEGLTHKDAVNVRRFHASIPEYVPTPLADLKMLAAELQVAKIFVKDESQRFGLNAFKALGGSYAKGRWIASRMGILRRFCSVGG